MKRKLLALAVFISLGSVTLISVVLSASTPNPTAAPPMTTAFGPKQYTRAAGQPQTFTETFQHCGIGQCQIVVANGSGDQSKRASSASISLNGRQIVGPRDLNQKVATITKSVTLLDQNQLTITLSSSPGSTLTVSVECVAPAAVLEGRAPGATLLKATTLSSAFRIANIGTVPAENVQITSLTLPGGTLTTPTLPNNLGTIPAGGSTFADANFTGGPFLPNGTYSLTVQGTYRVGASTFCFTFNLTFSVPPDAPGSAPLSSTSAGPNFVTGAPFPPQPPEFEGENREQWTPPIGPFVPGTPTQISTNVQTAPPLAKANAGPLLFANAPGTINFVQNAQASTYAHDLLEPSGAIGGGVVFVTGNRFAAYSTNNGGSFTEFNPTTVFPNDAIGFCCDQVVQYVPSIDRFIWVLKGPGGYRLASASPATIISSGGTAWTYWNLPPTLFRQPAGTGLDYPDLSVGENSLHLSWDVGWPDCPSGCNKGVQVSRISLAGIQAGGTITIGYTNPPDSLVAWLGHLMQNTLGEIFWAGHRSNSQMRVFSLAEDSNTYFWRDVNISSWARGTLDSRTPDDQNWLGRADNTIQGSTRIGSQLWFAWTAGSDSNFSQPHIEMVALDRDNNFKKIEQVQIWNNDFAFAFPALAFNACSREIGLSLAYGGNGNYENHAVGFWGDFVVYGTTASNVGTDRFGDYVTIRQAPHTNENPGNLFAAFGYGLNSVPPPLSGIRSDVRYVLFGRPPSSCAIK